MFGQIAVDTKAIGQSILDGKTKYTGTNEEILFPVLDSLLCKKQSDKLFYFKVANKTQQLSDGALSEHVSTIFSSYYFNQNSEFIDKSKTLSEIDIYKWLDYIAYNLYVDNKEDEKGLLKIKEKIKSLENKHGIKIIDDTILLKKYNDYLYFKTEKLVKAG